MILTLFGRWSLRLERVKPAQEPEPVHVEPTRGGVVPDWLDAPRWARYRAMSASGYWQWFENKPKSGDRYFYCGGRSQHIEHIDGWETTLEARPMRTAEETIAARRSYSPMT